MKISSAFTALLALISFSSQTSAYEISLDKMQNLADKHGVSMSKVKEAMIQL